MFVHNYTNEVEKKQGVRYTCIDACTHSYPDGGTEMRELGHKHSATHGHPCLHVAMHRGLR